MAEKFTVRKCLFWISQIDFFSRFSRCFWIHFAVFVNILLYLDTFCCIWIHFTVFGYIFLYLDTFRYIWIHFAVFRYILQFLGAICRISIHFAVQSLLLSQFILLWINLTKSTIIFFIYYFRYNPCMTL